MAFFHSQSVGAVGDEHTNFLECAGINQLFDTFPGGQLILGVLGGNARFTAARTGFRPGFFLIDWILFPYSFIALSNFNSFIILLTGGGGVRVVAKNHVAFHRDTRWVRSRPHSPPLPIYDDNTRRLHENYQL